ncbi:MAG: MBL fold metallo-hydrolase, partial [Chloroflexota bacterium]|nr:MBL fold metallo-hydrolase [Chloroflexota bacterium]
MTLRNFFQGLILTLLVVVVVISSLAGIQPAQSQDSTGDESTLYLPTIVGGNLTIDPPVEPNDASEFTKALNAAVYDELPFGDMSDFDDVARNLIAPLPDTVLTLPLGAVIWDPSKYDFIEDGSTAPDSVNPSLWRQSQLVNTNGLYKVTDRIYQVRNYDLSNMTIIEGDTGIIVVDPLMSVETAAASLALYRANRPLQNVIAVIYSHSHVDHWGGVLGVTTEEVYANGEVEVYAPVGFMEAASKENV